MKSNDYSAKDAAIYNAAVIEVYEATITGFDEHLSSTKSHKFCGEVNE